MQLDDVDRLATSLVQGTNLPSQVDHHDRLRRSLKRLTVVSVWQQVSEKSLGLAHRNDIATGRRLDRLGSCSPSQRGMLASCPSFPCRHRSCHGQLGYAGSSLAAGGYSHALDHALHLPVGQGSSQLVRTVRSFIQLDHVATGCHYPKEPFCSSLSAQLAHRIRRQLPSNVRSAFTVSASSADVILPLAVM